MPYIIISIILFIAITIAVSCFYSWIHNKNKKVVLEKSQRIKTLLQLNKQYFFKVIQSDYSYGYTCNSKRQLDNYDIDDYMLSLIADYQQFFHGIICSVASNKELYKNYLNECKNIRSTATEQYCKSFNFSLSKFLQYEENLFEEYRLKKPVTDISIHCFATYTSPQGRNNYKKESYYNYEDLKQMYDIATKRIKEKETREYQIREERSKMTNSLRYDILKRDGYKCQICGSTAQDGVKLHIDHIIPVSKGGRTVKSNLRTLCDRCNLGKSDKI